MRECCRNCKSLGYNNGYICVLEEVQDIAREDLLRINDINARKCEMYEEYEPTQINAKEVGESLRSILSKLDNRDNIFNRLGIQLKNPDGTFREFKDILKDLSEVEHE